ncbi:hypothetical protein MRB53_035350 [Persea americana]|uniref:Uncharacterized protein n=1 Tax=Persea americana TaxID=3435 RepID=A0ACC2K4P4_PERAE|nr:hypothetical protein MRB53_035350 [Persea americana]
MMAQRRNNGDGDRAAMDRGRWMAIFVDDGRWAAEDGSSSLLRRRRWTAQGDGDRRQQRSGGSGDRSR